jgi:hypothetical protein
MKKKFKNKLNAEVKSRDLIGNILMN